ncbi:hypothetical protein BO70DRAFT_432080 [Aspergillus heteromorphus CBS 117.55]|uniref:EAL domain-containing protein n=1 Tax=Aspergillus heteromorphus CBS 117.55 TaxID=1448321 RepID=A0A317V9D0_9EURO|nr:uncharacterized protein BO70DRAFT_432080 [Aspergillus heteromorphus CBS 117.55]PWY70994.1 hypothetical protein BO70DRAFT_432080 [Aspergillus heteromorphus CBS 117.55]
MLDGVDFAVDFTGNVAASIAFLVEEFRRGRFPIDKLERWYKVKDFEKAFEDVHAGRVVKAVLDWTD